MGGAGIRDLLRQCFPDRRAIGVAITVCVVIPSLLVALQIHDNPKFSPIDEAPHWDYVKRVARLEVPRFGQHLEPSTLREIACRGTDLHGLVVPPCAARHLAARSFPGGGEQYEAQQPPTYYALTVPPRWFGTDVLGLADVPATRAVGILWLTTGLLLLWCASMLVDLDVSVVGAGILLLATTPVVLYYTSIVSNDASSVFAGALVAFVAALAWKRPGRWATGVLGVTAFLVVTLKTTNLIPVTIVSVLFLFRAADRVSWRRPTWLRSLGATSQRWLRDGGALLVGGVVAAAAWVSLNRALALIDPKRLATFGVLRTHPVGSALLLHEAVRLLGPTRDAFVSPGTLGTNLELVFADGVRFLLIAGALAGLFVSRRRWSHWLGLITIPVLLVGGYLFGLGLRINYAIDPRLSGRYALASAPILVLVLIAAVRGRWAVRGLWALGVVTGALTVAAML